MLPARSQRRGSAHLPAPPPPGCCGAARGAAPAAAAPHERCQRCPRASHALPGTGTHSLQRQPGKFALTQQEAEEAPRQQGHRHGRALPRAPPARGPWDGAGRRGGILPPLRRSSAPRGRWGGLRGGAGPGRPSAPGSERPACPARGVRSAARCFAPRGDRFSAAVSRVSGRQVAVGWLQRALAERHARRVRRRCLHLLPVERAGGRPDTAKGGKAPRNPFFFSLRIFLSLLPSAPKAFLSRLRLKSIPSLSFCRVEYEHRGCNAILGGK